MKKALAIIFSMAIGLSSCAYGEGNVLPEKAAVQSVSQFAPGAFETLDEEAFIADYAWDKQSDSVLSVKLSNIYEGRLDQHEVLHVAEVKGFEDVPFVSAREYLTYLFGDTVSFRMDSESNVFKINRNGVTVDLTLQQPELKCDNWEWFYGLSEFGGTPEGNIVLNAEMNAITPSVKHEWTTTEAVGYSIPIHADGLGMVVLDRDVLLPFCVLQNTFGQADMMASGYHMTVAYNGDDFYDVINMGSSYDEIETDEMSPYMKAYYSGAFVDKAEMSPAYAKYTYATTCLLIDQFYGHKFEKGIEDLDRFIEEAGLKKDMCSTDPEKSAMGLVRLINMLFDTGHDSVVIDESIYNAAMEIREKSEDEGSLLSILANVAKPLMTLGKEQTQLVLDTVLAELLKPEEYQDGPRVDFEDDTAFIYFSEFSENLQRPESFYMKLPCEEDYENSTFALFYDAFRKIEDHGGIKNVVIDITDNGGGAAAALTCALGFLSPDGEVCLTFKNMRSNRLYSEWYHVDTNLDGKFDDNDGYGGDYNFYIVTSKSSYSCGNALPYFAQRQGLAKIVGEQPGGGDCVVCPFVDANGIVAYMSGPLKLGTMEDSGFVSNEDAVTVDLPFGDDFYNYYYNRPAIREFIRTNAK